MSRCYAGATAKRKFIMAKKSTSSSRVARRKPASRSKLVNPKRIMEMVWGFAPPLIAEAALQTGVFDAMDAGAKTAAQIGEKTNTSPRGIAILLDGLVATGLVERRGETFKLAP